MVFLITILLVFAIFSLYTYFKVFYSPKHGRNMYRLPNGEQYLEHNAVIQHTMEDIDALPFEQVYIKSHDGLRLAARYYHVRDNAPLSICFHGYKSSAIRDCSFGGFYFLKKNYNVLLVDQRAQCKSEGHTITFGVKEQIDCLDWVNYASARFGTQTKIVLFGVSMGATAVLLVTSLALPKNVLAAIADSPYSSPGDIIKKVCRDKRLPVHLVYPLIWLGAFLYGKFNLSKGNATDAVRSANIPMLIIHGEEDRFVPCEMSAEIACANQRMVCREIIPGAGHGLSYLVDKKHYEYIVNRFIAQHIENL